MPAYTAGMSGHEWAHPQADADAEADIETFSFDFRACVVP
jgi:hypothetical protein